VSNKLFEFLNGSKGSYMKDWKVFRWSLVSLLVLALVACTETPAGGDLPATPANFKVSSTTATSITLTWDSVAGATGYLLERGTGSSAKTQIAAPSSTTATYTDSGLTAGVSYGYALKAVNAKGNSAAALTAGLASAGGSDSDADGVSNADELAGWDVVISRGGTQLSTRHVSSDPSKADTDADGLTDAQERTRFTDPTSDDTDADGLKDTAEVNTWVSNPTDVDTDNDSNGNSSLFDGNELATYGTSPTLADTDGDGLTDHQEAIVLGNTFSPVIANTPRFELSFASAPAISLNIVKTSDNSLVSTKTSSLILGTSTSNSSTDTNTERFNAQVSYTVGLEAKVGLTGGVTASASVNATAGYGTENAASFTSGSSNNTQKTAEDSFTAGSTAGQTVSGATMSIGFQVANTGTVAFTLSKLKVSVLRRSSDDPTKFIFIGNMTTIPDLTLGVNGASGTLGASYAFSNADDAIQIMRNPANLRFELAGYDLLDGSTPPRNFAFSNDTTNGQTAQIVVDYGNGNVVRQRVATNVERVAGQIVGVKLGKVLKDILKLPYTTVKDAATTLNIINGVQDLKAGALIASKTATDPKSVWAVIGSNGLSMTGVDVDNILIKSGTELRLTLSRDVDGDGLLESEEYFYGSADTTADSDGDGLSDFDEVRTGWTVSVSGKTPRKVYPSPKAVDSDGDTLTDAAEKTKGTNPLLADTDGDGLLDAIDSDPLTPTTNPVITNFAANMTGRSVTLTANVSHPNLKDVVINWGDGTFPSTLTGAAAATVFAQHNYFPSGFYTITLTASDASTPTAKTAVQTVQVNAADITSQLLAWFKFNGPLSPTTPSTISSASGAVVDSSLNGGNATANGSACVLTDAGISNLVNTAYRFNFSDGGAGCGSSQHGGVSRPSLGLQNNYTFAVWIKPQGSLGNQWLMGDADTNGSLPVERLFIGVDSDNFNGNAAVGVSNKVSFMLPLSNNTIIVTDPTTVPLDTWSHYAVTVSYVSNPQQTTVKLYRNGVQVATAAKAANFINFATLSFLIGNGQQGASSGSGTRLFKGVMDEVRVYGRALSENDIVAVRDAPSN
jgi:Concanavalin A-like lectin/glucanases superfamily/Fibronectin type III domain/Bacterial TSP3 repeat